MIARNSPLNNKASKRVSDQDWRLLDFFLYEFTNIMTMLVQTASIFCTFRDVTSCLSPQAYTVCGVVALREIRHKCWLHTQYYQSCLRIYLETWKWTEVGMTIFNLCFDSQKYIHFGSRHNPDRIKMQHFPIRIRSWMANQVLKSHWIRLGFLDFLVRSISLCKIKHLLSESPKISEILHDYEAQRTP